jgi:hypothetical protein
MRQLKYIQSTGVLDMKGVLPWQQMVRVAKVPRPVDTLSLLLPICAITLWSISLKFINARQMNDLGLVSVLPPATIIALVILLISFYLALRQIRTPIILFHIALLIFMLYGMTTLVEEAPRFSVVYRHAGYTEYIMRTGAVDPNLDAYFNWPGFFILIAFLTRIVGYHDTLGYAAWAPVFLNLIYLGPLYMIFTSLTTEKRLVWTGIWFFYLTNWIGQDYFSPQGFNFFLYLVIIAILLKWFRTWPAAQPHKQKQRRQRLGRFSLFARKLYDWVLVPDTMHATPVQPRQRIALLTCIILIFALIVFSHPLTPFFVLASVTALVVFRRGAPLWLPVLMAIMTVGWILLMTQPFLAGHLDWVTGGLGQLPGSFSANVSNRVGGSADHSFIEKIRLIMTVLVWGLALLGAFRRLRAGYHDVSLILLAIAPFPLLAAAPYGGEMLLRIYFFALPPMAFFAASLFYSTTNSGISRWTTAGLIGMCMLLLGGFLFTRYGNERNDYMTNNEVAGVRYLYSIAQAHSLFVEGEDGSPWQFQDFELYDTESLTEKLYNAVATRDVNAIVSFIDGTKHTDAYVLFTRSQKATADSTSGLPPGSLDRLEAALLASGKFKMVYSNPDAQILLFVN